MSDRPGTGDSLLLVGEFHRRAALERALSAASFDCRHTPDLLDALDRLEAERFVGVVLGETDRTPSTIAVRLGREGHGLPVVALVEEPLADTTGVAATAPATDAETVTACVRDAVDEYQFERRRAARARRRAAVEAATDAAVANPDTWAEALCRSFATSSEYGVAWVGRRDGDRVEPVAAAGIPLVHLDSVPVDSAEDSPASWALETGAVATDERDTETVVAVPLDEPPSTVLHLVCSRLGGLSRGERSLLSSLRDSLAPLFEPERATDRVAVLGDSFAHELGNHLDIATTHLDLARDRGDESHFEHVESALDRMTALAEEARLLARGDVEAEAVDLSAAAAAAWDAVDTADASLDADAGTVDADPDLLGLLLENLFRNSVEHGGPDVQVRAVTTDDGFAVADDGPGIPAEDRDRVLEWGYSTDGTGVGLGIVALVSERHGWSIAVTESEAGGARFAFS